MFSGITRRGATFAALALIAPCLAFARPALTPLPWDAVPGWQAESFADVLPPLQILCARWQKLPPDKPLTTVSTAVAAGKVADWLPACAALPAANAVPETQRAWWQAHFTPWKISAEKPGLFTGYFEIGLDGSETPDADYRHPLHARPPDLVRLDHAAFGLPAGDYWGRVADGLFIPYPDRAAIESGQGLPAATPVLYWLRDPVDLFFLHIQGSGLLRLPDGRLQRVGFAAHNGHPFTAIGKVLIEAGEMTREQVNLDSLRAWLRAHPNRAPEVMWRNASYVFFQKQNAAGPVGAMGLPLTARRAVAVDPAAMPYGVPLWLDIGPSDKYPHAVRHLAFAMDTGAAIKGLHRGDVFWGNGPEAEAAAGHMANPGQYILLLPAAVRP